MPAKSAQQARYIHAALGSGMGKNPGMSKTGDFMKGTPLSGQPKRVRRPSGLESRALKGNTIGLSGLGASKSANKGDGYGY